MFGKKLIAILSFLSFLGVGNVALGTPAGVHVRWVQELDKPRLYLVGFTVVWPDSVPGDGIVTNQFIDYAYRVYCPTAMVRDVTGGNWGAAQSAWNNHSIGTGVLTQVIFQVCPEHHDRIMGGR